MRAAFRYLLVAALALSTCAMRASAAHAQELTPQQERLVLALIGAPVDEASVLMGAAPEGFPLGDLPPGATVLGSVLSRWRPLTVIAVSGAQAEGEAAMRTALLRAGWSERSLTPIRIFDPDGSWPARVGTGPAMFCRGDAMIRLHPSRSGAEEAFFQVHWEADAPQCGDPDYPPQVQPMLTPPEGARQSGLSGSSSSRRAVSSRVQIETDRTVEEVAAHYAAQLVAVGWTLAATPEPADGDAIASRSLTLETDDGLRWDGRLAVARIPGEEETEVHVTFERAGGRFRRP